MPSFPILPRVAAVLAALALAGCSLLPAPEPDPTRHYVLGDAAPAATPPAEAQGTLVVGLRTLQIAPYLDGKAMILRRGENEILHRDYARWAEPLAAGVTRTLLARLQTSAKAARVLPQPYPFDLSRDVDVSVSVLRCEGRVREDGTLAASLVCAVEIVRVGNRDGGGEEVLLHEVYTAPEQTLAEGDHAALAAALGRQVAALGDRIAAALPASAPAR